MTKKIISLVLAFSLVLGLCVTGMAAQDVTTLKDWDSVTDKDAALLLNKLEIMQGHANGNFNPENNVTRAQAAKMIAVAIWAGEDDGDMYAGGNPGAYRDVIPGYWYMGYVNFLTILKVMVGNEGNFRPYDTVSGHELLKMCLVCLGYIPEIEGLTGTGWDENTMALATEEGQQSLTEGIAVEDWSAPLTRMNSATIIKNMIFRNMVRYTAEGDIEYGSSFAEEVIGIDSLSVAEEFFGEDLLYLFEDLFGTTP